VNDEPPEGWIPPPEYARITARVPIVCVDLVAISESEGLRVGLINRPTYDGARGWCLIGGSVRRNETLAYSEASDSSSLKFLQVFEYFSEPELGPLYDPRKHAVSATFVGRLRGTPAVQDNLDGATAFAWFAPDQLNDLEFGFGQRSVIDTYLDRLDP
jgi:ADP-ribose pyrophosphatase YjhB (NUDIX family)